MRIARMKASYTTRMWKAFEKSLKSIEGKKWQKKVDKEEKTRVRDRKKKVEKCEVNKKWG